MACPKLLKRFKNSEVYWRDAYKRNHKSEYYRGIADAYNDVKNDVKLFCVKER